MPQSRTQKLVFTTMMVVVMVYGMICCNVSLGVGGLSNFVFVAGLPELAFMGPVALALALFVVSPIVGRRAAKLVGPNP